MLTAKPHWFEDGLQADKETLQEMQSDSDAMQERLQQLGELCNKLLPAIEAS